MNVVIDNVIMQLSCKFLLKFVLKIAMVVQRLAGLNEECA